MEDDDKNLIILILVGGIVFFVAILIVAYIFIFGFFTLPTVQTNPSQNNEKPNFPSTTMPTQSSQCIVSGCSRELCTDAGEDLASICIYKEEFKCYQEEFAKCEVQNDGKCGWTENKDLKACLNGQ
jgi:hypothetical protein